MPGTKIGGLRAAATNKRKYGEDFYHIQGAKGGKNGHTGGFASKTPCNCDIIIGLHTKPQCAGKKGGYVSRRGTVKFAPKGE